MSGKIYIVNVGSNASHKFCSPLFHDRTFEFIPIPEDRQLSDINGQNYSDLRSYYNIDENLNDYLPNDIKKITAHNDPEFDTFTYGDNCDVNPRAMSLRKVSRGDYLFFIARLENWVENKRNGNFGFYFIGYIHVDQILRSVSTRPDIQTLDRFSTNSHIRRAMDDDSLWDGFWVFGGSSWSKRFSKAVPVTKDFCNQVFVSASGQRWNWREDRSELQTIGSYTRSCRCAIDPCDEGGDVRVKLFWEWVRYYSG